MKYDAIGLAEKRRRHLFNAIYDTGEELFLGTCDSTGVGGDGVLFGLDGAAKLSSDAISKTVVRQHFYLCIQLVDAVTMCSHGFGDIRLHHLGKEKIFFMSLAAAILLFSAVLCIVYANKFKSAVAVGLLQTIVRYDDQPVDRLFVDKFQSFYNCCGVNGDDDYRDLSSVKLYGYKK
ncbi:unnamed protein product [Angiostrongylus costaricensis]|uniref:Transposase n=1 Tax=Angiostrongylus costaricensis TaxID=334426 RepID=A0A158PFM7_ANGCS|nr:unnamed protein product [Angiostrongylus costaricensis]